jgi:transposase
MHATVQPTIWEVSDDVWTMIEPILDECYTAKPKGHHRVGLHEALNGIIFRLRTAANGISCPSHLATTARCTGTASSSAKVASWRASEPCWSRRVMHWAGWTGSSNPPTPP